MIHSMKTQSYGPMENKKEEDTYVSTCGYCVCACVWRHEVLEEMLTAGYYIFLRCFQNKGFSSANYEGEKAYVNWDQKDSEKKKSFVCEAQIVYNLQWEIWVLWEL